MSAARAVARVDATKAFTSRRVRSGGSRSVAAKSIGTAGTAFRTFDSSKTDGQVFCHPVSIRGWPCFRAFPSEARAGGGRVENISGWKSREKKCPTTNRLVGIERGFAQDTRRWWGVSHREDGREKGERFGEGTKRNRGGVFGSDRWIG